jgi:hypothetical protein
MKYGNKDSSQQYVVNEEQTAAETVYKAVLLNANSPMNPVAPGVDEGFESPDSADDSCFPCGEPPTPSAGVVPARVDFATGPAALPNQGLRNEFLRDITGATTVDAVPRTRGQAVMLDQSKYQAEKAAGNLWAKTDSLVHQSPTIRTRGGGNPAPTDIDAPYFIIPEGTILPYGGERNQANTLSSDKITIDAPERSSAVVNSECFAEARDTHPAYATTGYTRASWDSGTGDSDLQAPTPVDGAPASDEEAQPVAIRASNQAYAFLGINAAGYVFPASKLGMSAELAVADYVAKIRDEGFTVYDRSMNTESSKALLNLMADISTSSVSELPSVGELLSIPGHVRAGNRTHQGYDWRPGSDPALVMSKPGIVIMKGATAVGGSGSSAQAEARVYMIPASQMTAEVDDLTWQEMFDANRLDEYLKRVKPYGLAIYHVNPAALEDLKLLNPQVYGSFMAVRTTGAHTFTATDPIIVNARHWHIEAGKIGVNARGRLYRGTLADPWSVYV